MTALPNKNGRELSAQSNRTFKTAVLNGAVKVKSMHEGLMCLTKTSSVGYGIPEAVGRAAGEHSSNEGIVVCQERITNKWDLPTVGINDSVSLDFNTSGEKTEFLKLRFFKKSRDSRATAYPWEQ